MVIVISTLFFWNGGANNEVADYSIMHSKRQHGGHCTNQSHNRGICLEMICFHVGIISVIVVALNGEIRFTTALQTCGAITRIGGLVPIIYHLASVQVEDDLAFHCQLHSSFELLYLSNISGCFCKNTS